MPSFHHSVAVLPFRSCRCRCRWERKCWKHPSVYIGIKWPELWLVVRQRQNGNGMVKTRHERDNTRRIIRCWRPDVNSDQRERLNEAITNHYRPPATLETTARHRSLLDVRIISFTLLSSHIGRCDTAGNCLDMTSRGENGRDLPISQTESPIQVVIGPSVEAYVDRIQQAKKVK